MEITKVCDGFSGPFLLILLISIYSVRSLLRIELLCSTKLEGVTIRPPRTRKMLWCVNNDVTIIEDFIDLRTKEMRFYIQRKIKSLKIISQNVSQRRTWKWRKWKTDESCNKTFSPVERTSFSKCPLGRGSPGKETGLCPASYESVVCFPVFLKRVIKLFV